MSEFLALYRSTLDREWRSKTIIVLGIITIAMIFLVNAGMDMFVEFMKDQLQGTDMVQHKLSVFFMVIQSWATLLGIILGVNTIAADSEGGMWMTLLSFPIPRWPYLLARMLGSATIVILYYLISLIMAASIYRFANAGNVEWGVFWALIPNSFLIIAVILISSFVSLFINRVVAFISSLFVLAIINASNSYLGSEGFKEMFTNLGFFRFIGIMIHMLFPRVGMIAKLVRDIGGETVVGLNPMQEWLHLIVTIVLWFLILQWFFKRKEV
jgi:ABC-type transport system involved in multi-copper enzyme maturation permease subunit